MKCLVFYEGKFYSEVEQYTFDPAKLPDKAFIRATGGNWYVNRHKKKGMRNTGLIKVRIKFVPKELLLLALLLT